LRLEPISLSLTDGYKAINVVTVIGSLPRTELAAAPPGRTREKRRGFRGARLRPSDFVFSQSLTVDVGPPTPSQLFRWTARPPLHIAFWIATPSFSPAVHAHYFYHNVAYYARKKFKAIVGYAFLKVRRGPKGDISRFALVCYGFVGLAREESKPGWQSAWCRAFSIARTRRAPRSSFLGKKRRLAHNAVHCFAMLSISSVVSKT